MVVTTEMVHKGMRASKVYTNPPTSACDRGEIVVYFQEVEVGR